MERRKIGLYRKRRRETKEGSLLLKLMSTKIMLKGVTALCSDS